MWNLKHVESFVRLARNLHFGRTAEELGISQPALSVQIRSLEKEVGGPLFLRTSRRIELTPVGEVFLKDAKLMMTLAARSRKNADAALRGRALRLAVGFDSSAISSGLARRTHLAMQKESPKLYVECIEAPAAQLPSLLEKGAIDVFCGAFSDGFEAPNALSNDIGSCAGLVAGCEALLDEAAKGLMPSEPATKRKGRADADKTARPYPAEALLNLPLLRCGPLQGGPDGLEDLAIETQTAMRIASMRLLLELVDEGAGAAVIAEPDAALAGPHTALRPLEHENGVPFRFTMVAARSRFGGSREAERFCELLADEAKAAGAFGKTPSEAE